MATQKENKQKQENELLEYVKKRDEKKSTVRTLIIVFTIIIILIGIFIYWVYTTTGIQGL